MARSAFGGACGVVWHCAQLECAPTACSAGNFAGAWQLAQLGGAATPEGPCARWQVAQPPGTASCDLPGLPAWLAWHEAHVADGSRVPACDSWQLAHFRCPAGAVACSRAWHVAHAGAAVGLCVEVPWQLAHAA